MTFTRTFIAGILGLLLAIDVHECFHAWVADRLGDPTGRYMGRISLNPIVHLDPLGTIMLLFSAISGRGIGWGKPVPVNPRNLRYGPRIGMGIVSLAGPFANLVTAAIMALPFRLRLVLPGALSELFGWFVVMNIGLAVFNLIPLPPLDGGHFLPYIFPRASWTFVHQLEQYGPFILILLVMTGATRYIMGPALAIMNGFYFWLVRLLF